MVSLDNSGMRFLCFCFAQKRAFTLAELLISLVILGVIATFTIPKVLQSQQNGQLNAIAKETAGSLSNAYQVYKSQNTVTGTTTIQNILGSLNYVKIDTTSVIDGAPDDGATTEQCSSSNLCYRLHNGALIWTFDLWFNNTDSTNAVYMLLDPDGKQTNKKDSLTLFLYYDGKIRTWTSAAQNSYCSDGGIGPDPTGDPAWFSWS